MSKLKEKRAALILLLILSSILFSLPEINVAEAEPKRWQQTSGGADDDGALSLIQKPDGRYALAGYTRSYGAGEDDFWLVKIDGSGNMLWNRTYGGAESDIAFSLIETSDGGYALAGYTGSFGAGGDDFWLVKTDDSGNMEWNQTYGGTDADGTTSLIQTSDGGYALLGSTESFGAGSDDFWLVKTDASGNMQWNQTYGGIEVDIASSLIETSDGGFALAGYTYAVGSESSDLWLIKTDEQGLIPEFPSLLLAILLLVALMLTLVLIRRRLPSNIFAIS